MGARVRRSSRGRTVDLTMVCCMDVAADAAVASSLFMLVKVVMVMVARRRRKVAVVAETKELCDFC